MGSIRKMNQRTSCAPPCNTRYSLQESRIFSVRRLFSAAFPPALTVKTAIDRHVCNFSFFNKETKNKETKNKATRDKATRIEWPHMALGVKPKEFCCGPRQGN
jgi:hypothetical protein